MTPPAISSASVNGATLVLTFNGGLDGRLVPAGSAFTVARTRAGSTTTVPLTQPSPVAVSGTRVTLSLAEAVVSTDSVTVSYAAPGTGAKLRDADHDAIPVPNFAGQGVENYTSGRISRAAFYSAAVNGNALDVTFISTLSAAGSHTPPGSAFTVTATPPGGTARTISGTGTVDIDNDTVTLNLADAVYRSERVTVSYARPSTDANALRYSPATQFLVDSFSGQPATNNTPGTPAPTFSSASYEYPGGIRVNFTWPFTGCANRSAWTLKVDGTLHWPQTVYCEGRSVRLYLDILRLRPQVEAAHRVTVGYNRSAARLAEEGRPFFANPGGLEPSGTRLRGTDGSEVANFTDKPVTGLKPRLVPPPTVEGETLTLTFTEEMDPGATAENHFFHVTVNNARRNVATGGVAISGKTVRLTLRSAVAPGDTVLVRYTRPGGCQHCSWGLRGASHIAVDTFPDQEVFNLSGPLSFVSAEVNGATLTVTFNRELDPCCGRHQAWRVVVDGTARNIASLTVSGKALTLTLASPVVAGQEVHVIFDGVFQAPQDLAGVRLTPFSAFEEVTNNTPTDTASGALGGEPAFVTGVEVASDAGADKTYGLGDTVRVRVTFDQTVEVTGTPRLKIDMDPAEWGEKWASYESGSGTGGLIFAHTVVEPNISTQGVAVLANTLELNGGTIRAGGADARLAHDGLAHDPDHQVDWQATPDTGGEEDGASGGSGPEEQQVAPASVSGVAVSSSPQANATYGLGETIRITLSFTELQVDVDTSGGTPRLKIDMDPAEWGEKWASYESGSGTSALAFTHTVVEPNISTQGVAVLANTLELNGGSIRSDGVDAGLAHTGLAHDANHKVDWQQSPPNRAPVVNTGAAKYQQFTGAMNVPRGVLVSKSFHGILSDPDGDDLTYAVSIAPEHLPLVDGDELAMVLTNPGRLTPPADFYPRLFFRAETASDWKAASPALADPLTIRAKVTATDPDGLSASVDGLFAVDWESHPEVVRATASEQAIQLTFDVAVEGDPAPAPEQFTVNVVNGDGTTGAIAVSGVSVNGKVVTLALASPPQSGQTVTLDYAHDDNAPLQRDGGGDSAPGFSGQAVSLDIAPPVPAVTGVAVTSDPGDDDTYRNGDVITVSVTFDENVDVDTSGGTPRLKIDMDPAEWGEKWAAYAGGSGTASLTFTHTVVEPNISTQGIAVLANTLELNGGTIESKASDTDADLSHDGLNHDAEHKVDWQAADEENGPGGTSGDDDPPPPPANSPATGAPAITGTARVGETLTADTSGIADADGLTGATFSYQWLADDADISGATGSAYTLASTDVGKAVRVRVSFTDDAGHAETLTSAATAAVAAKPPEATAVAVTSDPGDDDTYGNGDVITVSVTFDEAVDVDTAGGTPRLKIDMDPAEWGEKWASYASGSGTASLTFTHTVVEPNISTQGIAVLENTLELNGGTIRSDGADAGLAHTGLAHDADHKVDWQQSPPPANSPATGAPAITGTARVGDTLTADTSGISDADGLTGASFSYQWLADDAGISGATGSTYAPASADVGKAVKVRVSFTDDAGHAETLTSAATAAVAAKPPEVTGVAVTSDPGSDDTYGMGDVIRISVTFDQAVDVTGAPRIAIDMDPADWGKKLAAYQGGSGTKTLTFTHTVVEPNYSTQGIALLANTLELNGGDIESKATDTGADLSHTGLAHDPNHKVDWRLSDDG